MSDAPTRFRELRLQPTYQPHDDRLGRFYIPRFELATTYDRLVGYWRSSSLVVAAAGLTHFIHNARSTAAGCGSSPAPNSPNRTSGDRGR